MADLRTAVAYLLRLRVAFTDQHVATLAAVPLPRARAYLTELRAWRPDDVVNDASAQPGVVEIGADGSITAGVYARRWIAIQPKTRPGGNATEYRRQREVRAELEQRAWRAARAGKLLPDLLTSQEGTPVDSMAHMSPTQATAGQSPLEDTGLTLEQAAIALRCSTKSVRRRVHDGKLRAVKFGALVRIPASEVQRVLAGVPR